MDDAKKLASAVLDLTKPGATKRTKMGRLRELLPAIEEAHAKGVSHEEILKTLNEEGGFNLQVGPFRTMLWRIRNAKDKTDAKEPSQVPAAPAVSTPGKDAGQKQAESVKPAEKSTPGKEAGGKQESSAPPKPGQLPKYNWDPDKQKPEW